MSNVVLKLCRETNRYPFSKIAKALGITVKLYTEIEDGEVLLNREQSEKLGKLYKLKSDYFYTSALQLDCLLVRKEVIRILKWKNDQLEGQLKRKIKQAPRVAVEKRKTKAITSVKSA
jgi:transcriptional regulator with XRE-family HTH domain